MEYFVDPTFKWSVYYKHTYFCKEKGKGVILKYHLVKVGTDFQNNKNHYTRVNSLVGQLEEPEMVQR